MPLKIVVVGAGIGGLAAGAALAQVGHTVTIYERGQLATDVGFAFRITPNSDRCLKHLGIDTVATGATQANSSRQFDHEGNVIMQFGENRDAAQVKRGVSVFASRPQIVKGLLSRAQELGVRIEKNARVDKIDVEKATLSLADSTEIVADLIVGADGLHSDIRPYITDTTIYKLRSSPDRNCFRFMIPRPVIKADEILSHVFTDDFRMVSWKGQDKLIISYPVDFDSQYNFVCTHPASLSDCSISDQATKNPSQTEVTYNKKVSLSTVHEIYSEFESRLHRLFEKADPDGFRIWKLQDMDEIPTWSANRTVLIGDAAHAVLPFGFSGASMAIEDAVVLAELLPVELETGGISARLQLFERLRKPRVKRVRETSVAIGGGDVSPEGIGEYMKWLAAYDAVQIGRDALREIDNGEVHSS